MSETPLEQAIAFIESLTVDPLLMGVDDIEMTLKDVQDHARIELESIKRKVAAYPAPLANVRGAEASEAHRGVSDEPLGPHRNKGPEGRQSANSIDHSAPDISEDCRAVSNGPLGPSGGPGPSHRSAMMGVCSAEGGVV